ncbi:TATA binding protein of transcription factor TFIID [Staphylothermus marinus F1]|uniref:TATA-box-binding protein n=1 Tax=Staphylothermus marinus (strain ATCC 43588 / DSM 3639 / JCM 9404 / F1) TaxID=399550 RepID=A3DP53_STAMF|nr:TATA-box-binding protein [Staphylothermus marinus]ABN70413.1 TATA binding protein of transcription factor TFIID [Staphylothermus marinus F1]
MVTDIKREIDLRPTTKIENIVATVILDQSLDLNLIESRVPNVSYQPDQFPGLILRLEKPKTTALIFKSGKMVVTGAKSTQQLIDAVKKIIKLLRKYGIKIVSKPRIQIQNIVASGDINAYINLERAAYLLEDSMYEPEQFPGLIHRMREPRVVLLIFSSGKMVITGAKEESEVETAVRNIAKKLLDLDCLLPKKSE